MADGRGPTSDRRRVVAAGYLGDDGTARAGLRHDDPAVRVVALGALDRLGALSDAELERGLTDSDPAVQRRAIELAARRPHIDLSEMLDSMMVGPDDPVGTTPADSTVLEALVWACGEHERADVVDQLIQLASHDDPLVREASVASLGAIGDERGLAAIIGGLDDVPHVRRRAVLALAPFEGPEVDAALERAAADRDWQVRQGADDLLRVQE